MNAPHPTEDREALLAQVFAEIPLEEGRLTPEDINRLAAEWDERKSEGRIMRPFRQSPHGD